MKNYESQLSTKNQKIVVVAYLIFLAICLAGCLSSAFDLKGFFNKINYKIKDTLVRMLSMLAK